MLFLFSCVTYNQRIADYYAAMRNNNYTAAEATLEKTKILQAKRNRLLYLFEKGKMAHLMKQYDSSNRYFNEADIFMEDVRTSASDVALGTLLNPMMQTYKGEAFEKFMLHYYKALNYLYLGKPGDALVEARRISLSNYELQDKTKSDNKYNDDAFSLMMQGIIYQQNDDWNNAFIAYRNSVDLFLKNNNSYYGVPIPQQLKQDLLRAADKTGFTDELGRYEKLMNTSYQKYPEPPGGELVLFWENGLAPVKEEQNFFFALTKDGLGNFAFVDPSGSFNIPFNFSAYNINSSDLRLADLRSFRVAFPRYVEQPMYFRNATVTLDNQKYSLEQAQNINTLAFTTLRERFLKEMSTALARLVVKKLAEMAARPKSDDKNKDTKEAIALAIQAFSFATEKADTRNWQSLPHTIYYTRIPLQKGTNQLQFQASGQSSQTINLVVEGRGGQQVQNIVTLR
ncbi:hypothetical protein FSB84_06940 [Pseudobacter ginsenosidimutans]|nr:hypothetical protein FSB84_06940 [Pseudobacter ginsenosidimutans]